MDQQLLGVGLKNSLGWRSARPSHRGTSPLGRGGCASRGAGQRGPVGGQPMLRHVLPTSETSQGKLKLCHRNSFRGFEHRLMLEGSPPLSTQSVSAATDLNLISSRGWPEFSRVSLTFQESHSTHYRWYCIVQMIYISNTFFVGSFPDINKNNNQCINGVA